MPAVIWYFAFCPKEVNFLVQADQIKGEISPQMWGIFFEDINLGADHPAPFNMKLLGIGNENWGPQYLERFKVFQEKIKAKYPNIKLICSAGPAPEGERLG
jgi:hypothetical protein